jgi:hypothetical protein
LCTLGPAKGPERIAMSSLFSKKPANGKQTKRLMIAFGAALSALACLYAAMR